MILYTIGCPKCLILEKKLEQKGIKYTKETNVEIMLSLGITTAPVLQYKDKFYNFSEAVKLINGLK